MGRSSINFIRNSRDPTIDTHVASVSKSTTTYSIDQFSVSERRMPSVVFRFLGYLARVVGINFARINGKKKLTRVRKDWKEKRKEEKREK